MKKKDDDEEVIILDNNDINANNKGLSTCSKCGYDLVEKDIERCKKCGILILWINKDMFSEIIV